MRQAKQEANEYRRQIQALNCDIDALKSTVRVITSFFVSAALLCSPVLDYLFFLFVLSMH